MLRFAKQSVRGERSRFSGEISRPFGLEMTMAGIYEIRSGRVLPLKKLLPILRKLKKQRKRVAFTNGCFDLLHIGHLTTLEQIKRRADVLVVAVNSDSSVRGLKGPGRPVVPARERARLVAALKPVDFATVFSETTPLKVIRAIRPDLLAKGGDWQPGRIVGAEVVKSYGGRVAVIPTVAGHSTTNLLNRMKD